MANNGVNILNTIWANADSDYQSRVPQATDANIQEVGNPIINYSITRNTFLDALVNRIAFSVVSSRMAKNPIARLKKGTIPLGQDVQDIYVNMATAEPFNKDSTDLLKTYKPDVKSAYYRMNRQDKYSVSISPEMLQTAFTSYDNFNRLINGVIESIYSGAVRDEFILMKNLVISSVYRGLAKTIKITDPTTSATSNAFLKKIRTISREMKYPSSSYNMYLEYANLNGLDDKKPVETWTPLDRQVVLITAETLSNIDVDSLAPIFNLSKADFMQKVIEVDKFDDDRKIKAIVCDEGFFQIWDNLTTTEVFRNGDTLTSKYIFHKWQNLAVSPFANAVCFITDDIPPIAINADDITIEVGDTATINPRFTPNFSGSNPPVSYTSSSTSIATVNNSGVVTGVATGECTITITSTATYPDGTTAPNKEITVTVTSGS